MAEEKNIQMQDMQGNNVFPKTKAEIVFNKKGDALGDVEAGAQVNKIETVKVNGTAVTIADKAVDITVPAGYIQSSEDTSTVDITVADAKLTAAVKVSAADNNAITTKTDGLHVDISGKLDKNADITGATKCKITYDAKGLVTAGEDINLADVKDVTATAAEVNVLDGITASTAELNIMDGVEASTTEINYVKGVTSAIQTQIDAKVAKADIADNLTTDDATKVLSAKQGKALKDICDSLSAIGRFLSTWNCVTGKPGTEPKATPYTYHSGDYYIVGEVADAEGEVNHKPDGTSYTGAASTVEETEVVKVNDVYYFDGTVWKLMVNSGRTVSFANIAGNATDNASLAAELNKKLDANTAITAGTHTKITYDVNGLVTAGEDITLADVTDVTATKDEVNALHEAGAVKADFVKLAAITATAAEISELHEAGAVKADLVKLHAITATAAEVNYLSGVTSNVQTQLDGKQASLTEAQMNAVNSGATKAKVDGYDTHVANADIHVTAAQKTAWTAKQDALTETQLAAVNSGITAAKVSTYDGYATTIAGKADKATTLAGYGITDALTYVELA